MKQCISTFLSLAAILGLICSVACVGAPLPAEPTPPQPPPSQEMPPEQAEPELEKLPTFPLTVVDDLGRTVKIEKLPQRIISLAPSNTEIIYALELEDRLVGTTDYCDYPEAAKYKPRVAGYVNPDLEKVVSQQPDLIIAEAIHENTVLPALEKLGLTVIIMSASSLDVVLDDIKLIGEITGKSKAATKLVDDLTKRIQAVTTKTSGLPPEQRPRVLYAVWYDPIWTMGSETFIDDLIWKAGGANIFSKDFEKSHVVSLESIISKNPQVIIVSGMGTTGDLIYNNIMKETRLRGVDAMRDSRVYKISDANLIERPGPRVIDGLEEMAKLIHPEIFGMPE
ncbi:MAG: cobalamin-binding protein [Dehalococcoidia bacterium]|nr:cobalamin-binding protein [Dehalococcoidia bacterium]